MTTRGSHTRRWKTCSPCLRDFYSIRQIYKKTFPMEHQDIVFFLLLWIADPDFFGIWRVTRTRLGGKEVKKKLGNFPFREKANFLEANAKEQPTRMASAVLMNPSQKPFWIKRELCWKARCQLPSFIKLKLHYIHNVWGHHVSSWIPRIVRFFVEPSLRSGDFGFNHVAFFDSSPFQEISLAKSDGF